MTNTVLRTHLVKPLWSLYFLYNFVNFCVTKYTGEAIYPFMDWKTIQTPLILLGMMLAFTIIYITMCKIDEIFKKKLVKQIKQDTQSQDF